MFAIFVGISMIAIALALSIYAYQSQQHRMEVIQPRTFSYETASIADFARDDAIATLTNRMRAEFQRFFATQIITPPDDAWENLATFNGWFQHDLAASDTFTSWFAHRLALELQMYQDLRVGDYQISVDADEKAMQTAIKHGSRFIIFPDGTFAYVLDTEKLSPEDYAVLPKIVLSKGFQQSSFPVFPRKKWSVFVPLRVDEAYKRAKLAKAAVMSNISDYMLAIGACEKKCPLCAVYDMQSGERLYPNTDQKDCFLSTEEDLPEEGKTKPVTLGSVEHACTNQYLDLNGAKDVLNVPDWVVNTKIPCFTGEKSNQYNIDEKAFALYNILEYRLAQQAQKIDPNLRIDIDPGSFKTYQTMKVCSQRAISLSQFVATQMPGMEWILKKIGKAIGLDLLAQGVIGLSSCQEEGYLTCSAPTNFTIVVTWTDPDLNHSVLREPASFHFRIPLSQPFQAIDAELTGMQEEVNQLKPLGEQKPIGVKEDEAQKLDRSCVNRMLADCMAQYYRAYADCDASPEVNAEMHADLEKYYSSDPKNPLWNVCGMDHWPERPAPCTTFYLTTAAEVPAAYELPLILPQANDWKQSKITESYFSSFVPAVTQYIKERNQMINEGTITDPTCKQDIQTLSAIFGDNGYCAKWDQMKQVCIGLSMSGKTMYPQCPESEDTAYSTFWVHVFATPMGTCSYGKESVSPP